MISVIEIPTDINSSFALGASKGPPIIKKQFDSEAMNKFSENGLDLRKRYNWKSIKLNKGSAIFIHITKDYRPTAGCIGLSEKDFLILIKIIKKNTIIKIL